MYFNESCEYKVSAGKAEMNVPHAEQVVSGSPLADAGVNLSFI
jgi:hypothetical protein